MARTNRFLTVIALTAIVACRQAEDRHPAGAADPIVVPVPVENAADAVSTSSEHYRVLVETPSVRMLLASWGLGERDRPHSHPVSIWYALSEMTLRIESPGSGALLRAIASGDSGVQQPVATHSVGNVGTSLAQMVMFEITPQPLDLEDQSLEAHNIGSADPTIVGAPAAVRVSNDFQPLESHGGYRLIEAVLAPSRKIDLHSHATSLWFALTDANLRLSSVSGPNEELNFAQGKALLRAPVRAHTVENIGTNQARLLILEESTRDRR